MKILYFSYADLDTPSACQTHTLGVLRGLAANGCQVDAVTPRPLFNLNEIPGVRFHTINPHRGKRRYLLREIPYSALRLAALCLRNRYDAIYARDYPTVLAINFVVAAIVILGNLLTDVAYGLLDPRISFASGKKG